MLTFMFGVTWYFQTPSNYSLYEGKRKNGREKETEKERKMGADGDGERENIIFKSCYWTREYFAQ